MRKSDPSLKLGRVLWQKEEEIKLFLSFAKPSQSEVCCDCFRPEEGPSTIWWNYLILLLCFRIKQTIFFIKKKTKKKPKKKITFGRVCF